MNSYKIKTFFSFSKIKLTLFFFTSVTISLLVIWVTIDKPQKAEIYTESISQNASDGRIIEGKNSGRAGTLSTKQGSVTHQSYEIVSPSKTANALVIGWSEDLGDSEHDSGRNGSVEIQARTNSKGVWSKWVRIDDMVEDRKDGSKAVNKALVLANSIEQLQYRITVVAGTESTPVVNLDKTELELIDASRGPDLTEDTNIISKLFSAIFPLRSASARAEGPKIYQREEWGGWENPSIGWYPNSSPAWPEQYEPLKQVIVHHTATTVNGDSFAAMRAIWQFHANSNGWGDIGYNYVVDPWGNIFKGRHYVEADAAAQGGEVVGGHAYEHNRGTTGISLLGDYTTASPAADALYSVSRIAALKASAHGFNPADLSNLIGHRDATSTGCPGESLYARLPELRKYADIYYTYYVNMDNFDGSYRGQDSYSTMWPNTEAPAYLDIKNESVKEWMNSGAQAPIIISDRPRGHMSQLCASDWLDCSKIGTFSEKVVQNEDGTQDVEPVDTIQPGETARFNFKIKAPGNGGVYREFFNLATLAGNPMIRNLNIYYDLNVPNPTYEWKMREQSIFRDVDRTQPIDARSLLPDTVYYARVKAYNAGNQSWHKDGQYPVRFATSTPIDRSSKLCNTGWIHTDCNRPASLMEAAVAPMSEGTFEFTIKTPTNAGEFRENFNLMVERKYPMSGENQYWDIKLN